MPALVKTAPGSENLELREVPRPGPPAPEHVLVRVLATGICGTDLHIQHDEYPSVPPVTMGHEIGGVVHELGAGVPESWQDQRVAVEPYFHTCGRCQWCRSGSINLCPERRSLGTHVDGGFAEYVSVPAINLHLMSDLPESVLPDHALPLLEPLACVCHNLLDPPITAPGDRVLVTGPGAVGILAAQVAAAAGAEVAITGLAGRDTARLAVASALGIRTVEIGPGTPLRELSPDPHGFDAVIECSGAPAAIVGGLAAVRRRGAYVQIGLASGDVSMPINEVCYREIQLRSDFASTPASWQRAERLVRQRWVALAPLVSEAVPLAGWREAFAATSRGEGVKFVLVPKIAPI